MAALLPAVAPQQAIRVPQAPVVGPAAAPDAIAAAAALDGAGALPVAPDAGPLADGQAGPASSAPDQAAQPGQTLPPAIDVRVQSADVAPPGNPPAAAPAAPPGGQNRDSASGGQGRTFLPDRRSEPAPAAAATTATGPDAAAGQVDTPTAQVLDLLRTMVAEAEAGTLPTAADDPATTADDGSAATPDTAGAVAAARTVAVQAARTSVVTLELNPANLGRVTVTLRLRSNAVDVRIAVQDHAVLSELSADSHLLTSALGDGQGRLDLALAPPPGPAADKGAQDGRPSVAGQNSDAAGRNGQAAAHSTPTKATDDETPGASPQSPIAARRDGSLYL